MITRDCKSYLRRRQIGFDGKENNIDEKPVDFVVGSGNHSRTKTLMRRFGITASLSMS